MGFAEAVHPMGGIWVCGTCEVRIQAGHCCPDCGTVLCDECVAKQHDHPAGARAGKRCRNSAGVEAIEAGAAAIKIDEPDAAA